MNIKTTHNPVLGNVISLRDLKEYAKKVDDKQLISLIEEWDKNLNIKVEEERLRREILETAVIINGYALPKWVIWLKYMFSR